MKIADFCSQLSDQLVALPSAEKRMEAAVPFICRAFRVKTDEVAIFSLDPERELLCFLWPEKLQHSGLIPLSSSSSLAARTVRENKAYLDNHFATAHHTFIFEAVPLRPDSKKSSPIQKILSAPLPGNGYVKGVIQISRKGEDPNSAGEDFTKNDLQILIEISRTIASHL
jgi:GAF domain-containing protein